MVKFEIALDKNNADEMLAASDFFSRLAAVSCGLAKGETVKAETVKAETAKEVKAEPAKEAKAQSAKEEKPVAEKEVKAQSAKEEKPVAEKEVKAETVKAETPKAENPLAKVKELVKAKKDDHRQEIREVLESVGAKTIPTIPKDKIAEVIEKLEAL